MSDSDLRFHEENSGAQFRARSNVSGITGFLINKSGGLIQNQQQANVAMIVMIVLSIFFAVILMPEGEEAQDQELVAPAGKTIEYREGVPPRVSN